MTREDWIWVAIRIFGIYLLVLALVSIPNIIHSGMMARTFWHLKDGQDASTELSVSSLDVVMELSSKLFSSFLSSVVSGLFKLILFTACGIYFLRGGELFFRLISKTGHHRE